MRHWVRCQHESNSCPTAERVRRQSSGEGASIAPDMANIHMAMHEVHESQSEEPMPYVLKRSVVQTIQLVSVVTACSASPTIVWYAHCDCFRWH